jgi:tetratricopeptide (TPR) repeat protein
MTGREDIFNQAMNEGHSAAWDQAWDQAVGFYQTALDEFPDNFKALNSLGLALYELQRLDESLQTYQRASQASPGDPLPLERIAQLSERLGQIKVAVQAAMQAAELFIKNKNVDKAIENWLRVTQLAPENATAHSNLALVHAKLGHNNQAVMEYLALASLLQRSGKPEKASEIIARALVLSPNSSEARQAASLLKNGHLLPPPMRPKGGTGPLRMASIHQLQAPEPAKSGIDPISEARHKALTKLAKLLFEFSDGDKKEAQPATRRGMRSIVTGTEPLVLQKGDNTLILLHLGQAIDAQTHGDDPQAAEELEKVLEAGFDNSAISYDLGMLHAQAGKSESALRYLGQSVKHADYALGARLLMGQTLRKMGRVNEACIEYLEALKLADSMVVSPEQSDTIRQLYEPLIEAQAMQTEKSGQDKVCDVIEHLLNKPDWLALVANGRAQLPEAGDDSMPLPLAEIITQTRSSLVIEAMSNVHKLARGGYLRSAMEEAYNSLQYAPTYLPLHTLISELLIQDENIPDAITKLSVVAHAYSVRGESKQATKILRRVIQLAPMDLPVRTRLIDQLVARGQAEEALTEYLELADLYYRQADLDIARKTYTTALRLCQQSNVHSDWDVRILKNMADIDMQHLEWRQACRLYEQIRTIRPDDMTVRKYLIELNIRLGQANQAFAEIENFMAHLDSVGLRSDAIPFLEDLLEEYPQQAILRRQLAEEYRQVGRKEEAIAQLDTLGDICLDVGDQKAAIQAIETIIAMNPSNLEQYLAALAKLKSEL